MDMIEQAFHAVCTEAEESGQRFVSLYCDDRFYGGPEEGGWYGTDTTLVATQRVYSEQIADRMKAEISAMAEKLTAEAEAARNRHCAEQVEWLEARGLDDDFLRSPDGGQRFWVASESVAGSFVSEGDRCYS